MSGWFSIPDAAVVALGVEHGGFLFQIYYRAHALGYAWESFTERELADRVNAGRTGALRLLERLAEHGLVVIERAAPRTRKPSRYRVVPPVEKVRKAVDAKLAPVLQPELDPPDAEDNEAPAKLTPSLQPTCAEDTCAGQRESQSQRENEQHPAEQQLASAGARDPEPSNVAPMPGGGYPGGLTLHRPAPEVPASQRAAMGLAWTTTPEAAEVAEVAKAESKARGWPLATVKDAKAIAERVLNDGLTAADVRAIAAHVDTTAKRDPWWTGKKPGATNGDMRRWSYLLGDSRHEEMRAEATRAIEAAQAAQAEAQAAAERRAAPRAAPVHLAHLKF